MLLVNMYSLEYLIWLFAVLVCLKYISIKPVIYLSSTLYSSASHVPGALLSTFRV